MTEKKIISVDAYTTMAEDYFYDIDTKPHNAYYERPAVVSLFPEVQGKRVLDAGCAAGWYTQWLLDHGASVMAIDVTPKMIEMTKLRVGERAEIREANLNEPLDFIPDESMDLVNASLVLHYLEDWSFVMQEFHRILKPEGILVFSTHHPFMDFTTFQRENYFAIDLLEDEWGSRTGKVKVHFYRRPLQEIVRPVLENGFILEKLLEPMPTDEFKAAKPQVYEKLTKQPMFLFIRAKKK